MCDETSNGGAGCGFNDLITLVNHLVTDLILLGTLFATAGFVYIGIKLLTAGGDEGAMKEAKASAMSILKGFVVILAAWLIVYTITSTLMVDTFLGAIKY